MTSNIVSLAPTNSVAEPTNQHPVTLAEFAAQREAAFKRLRAAAPGQPITFTAVLNEIATSRAEAA